MNSTVRNAVLWLTIICLVVLVWAVVRTSKPAGRTPNFSELVRDVKDGKVESVTINGATGDIQGRLRNKDEFRSTIPLDYPDFTTTLLEHGVDVKLEKDSGTNLVSIIMNAIPFVLLVGFWIFMMRQVQGSGNKALSFGKSRARLHSSQQKKEIGRAHV